jgi:archaellum biogenesis ATPase FlaH
VRQSQHSKNTLKNVLSDINNNNNIIIITQHPHRISESALLSVTSSTNNTSSIISNNNTNGNTSARRHNTRIQSLREMKSYPSSEESKRLESVEGLCCSQCFEWYHKKCLTKSELGTSISIPFC